MKRIVTVLAIAMTSAGIAFAQPARGGMGMGPNPSQQEEPKSLTIEGKLLIIDKFPALQTKDKTFILHWRNFYFNAYTDGIKEGSQLKVDGYELPGFPGQGQALFRRDQGQLRVQDLRCEL